MSKQYGIPGVEDLNAMPVYVVNPSLTGSSASSGDINGGYVQGNTAQGTSDIGFPVAVGGKAVSTVPIALVTGSRSELITNLKGALAIGSNIGTSNGADGQSQVAIQGIDGNSGALQVSPYLYNGSTRDQQRANFEATVLSSAARSADTNSSDIVNYNARGVVITIDLTVLGSTSVTFTVKYKDSLSGKYVTLLASPAVGVSTTTLTVFPGCIAVANSIANAPLPRLFRVEAVRNGTPGTDTYSISANFII